MCYRNAELTAEDTAIIIRVRGYRLGPVTVHADEERDAKVMLTQHVLAGYGYSPLDRELWAQEHGYTYTAGHTARVLAAAKARRASIVEFARKCGGDEAASRAASNAESFEFWAAKLDDCGND